MIRIDEIYNNVFWPWIDQNMSGTRMLFCDPPGHTRPENVFKRFNNSKSETDYVFFHDQEPVDIELYNKLFFKIWSMNLDLNVDELNVILAQNETLHKCYKKFFRQCLVKKIPPSFDAFFDEFEDVILRELDRSVPEHFTKHGKIIVSEHGEKVQELKNTFGWSTHYYFYHGWACQDWYRGYDRSFLIPRARDRSPTKTFISPNRIVGGHRDHRVLFLYNVFKNNLAHNHITAPRICSQEHVNISVVASKYTNVYNDITQIIESAELPRLFSGEETQQMTSCWLSNFTEAQDSLFYVPTETVYFGKRLHITEKTFKAIALEMPFILIAPAHSLEYLRSYGFQTFDSVIDESYDQECNDIKRIEKVTELLKEIDLLSDKERKQIHRACLPIVEHNFNHFYRGGFADTLWQELETMLRGLSV